MAYNGLKLHVMLMVCQYGGRQLRFSFAPKVAPTVLGVSKRHLTALERVGLHGIFCPRAFQRLVVDHISTVHRLTQASCFLFSGYIRSVVVTDTRDTTQQNNQRTRLVSHDMKGALRLIDVFVIAGKILPITSFLSLRC